MRYILTSLLCLAAFFCACWLSYNRGYRNGFGAGFDWRGVKDSQVKAMKEKKTDTFVGFKKTTVKIYSPDCDYVIPREPGYERRWRLLFNKNTNTYRVGWYNEFYGVWAYICGRDGYYHEGDIFTTEASVANFPDSCSAKAGFHYWWIHRQSEYKPIK